MQVRTDTIQTTEAYWKGSKKMGLLTYRTPNGYMDTIEVDEDLLKEVVKEYEIKTLRKTTISEYNIMDESEKENTIIWVDAPIVYRGVKIRVSGIGLDQDIYKVEELPYQIRGEKGNVFDVKLPVCGHIGNSFCEIIRPYQILFNYLNNQIVNYLQKEVGAFFVIDVNAIPTDYFEFGEGDDVLFEMRQIAKTTGFLPTDFSRNNLNQQGGLNFNPMVYNNASFTEPIMRNQNLAEKVKWDAYATLGLTPQSMGSPSEYATVEGIEVGQRAYFAQTYHIDQTLMENKRANAEIHMVVAQYCQLNQKDANYIYMASDDEINFINTVKDQDFALRQIDVRSTFDSRKNTMFQQLKAALIQNNTMGNDALALVDLFMSDDFLELKDAAIRARRHTEKMQQQQMQQQQEMQQNQIEFEKEMKQKDLDLGYAKIEGQIRAKYIDSLGRAVDRGGTVQSLEEISEAADRSLDQQKLAQDNENEKLRIQNDLTKSFQNFKNKSQELELKKQELELEREKLSTRRYVSDSDKFQSIINKN